MLNDIFEFYKLEHSTLRDELNNLKKCQVMFLSLSITGTGIILSLINNINNNMEQALFSLIPLIILIPFWFIFFDKAHTITRIVGYYRILEKLMLGKITTDDFIGWENSLAEFRKYIEKKNQKEPDPEIANELQAEDSNRKSKSYWLSVYSIFLGLSVICVLLGAYFYNIPYDTLNKPDPYFYRIVLIALKVASIIVFLSASYNLIVLIKLTIGKYSYTSNENKWKKVLNVKS